MRWQAQDAEGALLRDQLRLAAHLWEEKGRTDDLLWTGASFREYAVWRERYPGALSELEEAFARSMTELADRRRHRRRAAATTAIVVLLAVAAALSLLWHRSVQETRRAEASKLLALAQARLADDPTEALALTTASLEIADTREAREFVMRALAAAPPALELEVEVETQLPVPSCSERTDAITEAPTCREANRTLTDSASSTLHKDDPPSHWSRDMHGAMCGDAGNSEASALLE